MKYKLAIFDMDGTILDTLEDLKDGVNYALRQSNYPERTYVEVRGFVGNGIRKLIERAVPANQLEHAINKVYEDFIQYYKVHCSDKTKPYDGIVEVLQELRKKNIKTAVVSNKADYAVQDLCKRFFEGLFDTAIGEQPNIRIKPAADSVNCVLSRIGIARKNAIYIGDSEVDIETARNAELQSISVSWGFRDVSFLKERGAESIVNYPREILSYF